MAFTQAQIIEALTVGANSAFTEGLNTTTPQWDKIATKVPSTGSSEFYGWLADLPGIAEWVGARMLKELLESGKDNGCYGDKLATRYREALLAGELQYWDEAYFAGEAKDSLAKQRERERSDSLSFDDFLADYFGTSKTPA